ncbi:MAG: GNAT family N-acetyltransferase [Opitutae bacterium]|nr:GNAT family N-acetyltransferase [Opitutae bacterium]
MNLLETERLTLRRLTLDDAAFMFELANDPAWLLNIGDRGIRDLAGARAYLQRAPLASYARHGFGMYLVAVKATGESVGICGLLQRDPQPDIELGFAFLRRHWGHGYATEAGAATLAEGKDNYGLTRVTAVTVPANTASVRVLERLGLRFEKNIRLAGDPAELARYAREL